jgi:tetratricopeptide (TPR) repeat protein
MFSERFFRFIPRAGLKKALTYFNNGDYKRACREFELYLTRIAIEGRSQDQEMIRMYMVESYFEYAKRASRDGKHEDAARTLEKAVELQPRYADIHSSLGMLYAGLGRIEESRECFKRALDINPAYLRARVMLAKSYDDNGDSERAVAELETSLATAPSFFADQVKELARIIRNNAPANEREDAFRRLLEEKPSSAQVSKQIALEADRFPRPAPRRATGHVAERRLRASGTAMDGAAGLHRPRQPAHQRGAAGRRCLPDGRLRPRGV